jgi:hypothetical protein
MQFRLLTLCALASAVLIAGCDDEDDISSPNTTATVRFVNATGNSNISVAQNGTVGTGNSALGFGSGSSCMTVNSGTPNLTFTNSSTGASISGFTPNFSSNGNYTVVAYTDASGNTQFTTLNNSFTASSGQSGLRVFNAASGSGNVVLNGNGSALNGGSTTAFGNAGSFFSTPAGTSTYTFNTGTGTSTIATAGSQTLNAGQNSTAIIGPAATGSTTMRAFFSTGC